MSYLPRDSAVWSNMDTGAAMWSNMDRSIGATL